MECVQKALFTPAAAAWLFVAWSLLPAPTPPHYSAQCRQNKRRKDTGIVLWRHKSHKTCTCWSCLLFYTFTVEHPTPAALFYFFGPWTNMPHGFFLGIPSPSTKKLVNFKVRHPWVQLQSQATEEAKFSFRLVRKSNQNWIKISWDHFDKVKSTLHSRNVRCAIMLFSI